MVWNWYVGGLVFYFIVGGWVGGGIDWWRNGKCGGFVFGFGGKLFYYCDWIWYGVCVLNCL